jgi:hypothetical protein
MSKQRKKDRIKLPKRLLGVKIPKATRKQVNALLKQLPTSTAKPLLGATVGTLVAALAARLEQPLHDLIESYTRPGKTSAEGKGAVPTAH